jgi:hypothetical protein
MCLFKSQENPPKSWSQTEKEWRKKTLSVLLAGAQDSPVHPQPGKAESFQMKLQQLLGHLGL